jgi:acetyl esterase/lipase
MKTVTTSIVALALVAGAFAQAKEQPLWPNSTPGAKGDSPRDIPTLTPFLALASVSGFVLKYRLGSAGYRHPIMLGDAARALRTVRANAKRWKIDPDKIGIMGSSAGGHLASTLLTHYDAGDPQAADPIDRVSSRPSLGVLCYPVISMGEFTHRGSKRNLLGDKPAVELVKLLSNELQVTADTPPTFLWHTAADKGVPVENSLQFAAALRKAGVPFALHIYQKGRHGLGLADKPPFKNTHPWAGNLVFWLKAQGFIAE